MGLVLPYKRQRLLRVGGYYQRAARLGEGLPDVPEQLGVVKQLWEPQSSEDDTTVYPTTIPTHSWDIGATRRGLLFASITKPLCSIISLHTILKSSSERTPVCAPRLIWFTL